MSPREAFKLKASSKEEQYDSYIGQVARGAGISSVGQGVGRLLWYVTLVMLARMYGPAQLGFYILGSTLIQIVRVFGQFGLDNGLVRYVARYQAARDIPRVRGTILLALALGTGLSLVLSGLVFFGAGFFAELFGEETSDKLYLETIFKVFSLSIPFFTVMGVALWAIAGFQIMKYAIYVEQFALPLINLGLVVCFYFLLGARVIGAVIAYVLSIIAGFVLALYYLHRVCPDLFDWDATPKFEPQALLSASGPMVVASYAPFINNWSVITVLGAFASTTAVGIFNAASRTASVSILVLFAFGNIFAPMASSLYRRGSLEDLGYLYKDVSRWIFTMSLAIFLVTTLLARDFMALFGNDFISSWPVLIIVAGAEMYNSSMGPQDRLLAMIGHHRIVVLATMGGAIAAFVGSIVLIPLYDIWGAAAATMLAIVLAQTVMLAALHRATGYWPYNRQYVKPLIAGFLTAAAAFLVRPMLPLPADGLLAIIILGPCLLIGFGVIILILGLSSSDKQLLRAFWKAVRALGRDGT